MKEYHEDDRLIIPEDISRMSKAELQTEIARLEKEAFAERERIERRKLATA